MKRGWIILILVVVLIVGFFAFYEFDKISKRGSGGGIIVVRNDSAIGKDILNDEGIVDETLNIVEITSEGFNPEILEIEVGEEVVFINKDSRSHWPASNIHPTHRDYPGSDIDKCGTSEELKIFDSCKGLAQNEEYKFVFNEKGTWNYHDHLSSGIRGKIVVN
mgnify:CR=1 FL=1